MKNENYPLAAEHDPNFNKPHKYTKSYGDGSIRGHCRCERPAHDKIHTPKEQDCKCGRC